MRSRVMSEDEIRATARVELECQHHLAKVFEARKVTPTDDILSGLVHAHEAGEEPLVRRLHDQPEAIGGASVQALIEALFADAELVPKFVDGGHRIFEPSEDQRLHEVGSRDFDNSIHSGQR